MSGRSESERTIEYRAVGQVLSMAEYTAQIRLEPVTLPAGKTFIRYSRTFRFVPGTDLTVDLPLIIGIMDAEMVALRARFNQS